MSVNVSMDEVCKPLNSFQVVQLMLTKAPKSKVHNIYLRHRFNLSKTLDELSETFILPSQTEVNEYLEKLEKQNIKIIDISSEHYPRQLSQIPNPPIFLHAKGNFRLLQNPILSIVGARTAMQQSINLAESFANDLSEYGLTITSGFARGIDSAACNGAKKYGTIQVLAGGLDAIYPKQNTGLFHEVLELGGLFLSEQNLGSLHSYKRRTMGSKIIPASNFPSRNRIISGLSEGVLIVQAEKRHTLTANGGSGTLNTALTTLKQGRKLFAIPGHPMDSFMSGCNELIAKNQAIPVVKVSDILSSLNLNLKPDNGNTEIVNSKSKEDCDIRDIRLSIVSTGSTYEEIAQTLKQKKISIDNLSLMLSTMELDGDIIQDLIGRYYRKR